MKDGKSIASLLASLAITALALWLGPQLTEAQLAAWGYGGIFLLMLVTSATVILPVPGLAAVFILGHYADPILLGIAAGLGSGLGELSGYLAGYGGEGILNAEKNASYRKIRSWLLAKDRGALAIFALAAIPNPLFDLAGLAAGAVRYPVAKFLLACIAGKILKSIALAWLGSKIWL